jgi:hypothetical protein
VLSYSFTCLGLAVFAKDSLSLALGINLTTEDLGLARADFFLEYALAFIMSELITDILIL